jgi:hypothetical protein
LPLDIVYGQYAVSRLLDDKTGIFSGETTGLGWMNWADAIMVYESKYVLFVMFRVDAMQ